MANPAPRATSPTDVQLAAQIAALEHEMSILCGTLHNKIDLTLRETAAALAELARVLAEETEMRKQFQRTVLQDVEAHLDDENLVDHLLRVPRFRTFIESTVTVQVYNQAFMQQIVNMVKEI